MFAKTPGESTLIFRGPRRARPPPRGAGTAGGSSCAARSAAYTAGMPHPSIIPWDEVPVETHDRGYRLPLVDAGRGAHQLRLHVSVIHPGLSPHPPHAHPGEEIILLLEGTAEVRVGDETHVVRAPATLFFPEHLFHGLRNLGDRPMKYAVVRTA